MDEKNALAIFEEMGRLCVAWSYLELVTEGALWGVLGINDRLAPIITWKMDMESRGKLLVEYGQAKHPEELSFLREFNKNLRTSINDRNIIVHGRVHQSRNRPPCWTVFRGEGRGKNFPVSVEAAAIVRTNINNLATQLMAFNHRHTYVEFSKLSETVESNWPTPLEG